MRAHRLAILVVTFAACAKSQPASEVVLPPTPSSTAAPLTSAPPRSPALANPELRVIVPAAEGSNFYFFRPDPGSYFTPTEAEVAAFEAKLPDFLRAKAKPNRGGAPPLADRMAKYLRQYVGLVESDGKRRIWGNFFCEYFGHADGGWRKEGFVVKDGGDCYFNVKYEPATGAFSALMINGDA